MRHPLWILNSALFFLLIVSLCFALFARVNLPEWDNLKPVSVTKPAGKRVSEITISKIFENDLFGTYEKEPVITQEPNYIVPFPEPPTPREPKIPQEPKAQFLDPLKITLKGIIVVHNDDTKNRALISDTATGKEDLFKIGDMFEDAQLIKIFNKKVIFLRANGQQEVLYLRPKDAQLDPTYAPTGDWKGVVQQASEDTYIISPREFSKKVTSLAQFIELLDLTSVYENGKIIGCRIGTIEHGSLAAALGFSPGDIILAVSDIPAATSDDRLAIYKAVIAMKTNDTIDVHLLRNDQQFTLRFMLEDFKNFHTSQEHFQKNSSDTTSKPTKEQLEALQERHKFAPTLRDIREQERHNMLNRSRKNLTSKFAE